MDPLYVAVVDVVGIEINGSRFKVPVYASNVCVPSRFCPRGCTCICTCSNAALNIPAPTCIWTQLESSLPKH